uniref:Uncharacterized protein n=1 Tax=viral metagenome TaxID=1070528 RepID=A0A6M3IHB9_9ZZZZ
MAVGKANETLIAFESGHYKKIKGEWKGDSVWTHYQKEGGGMIHVNKDKVEYIETFGDDKGDDRTLQEIADEFAVKPGDDE